MGGQRHQGKTLPWHQRQLGVSPPIVFRPCWFLREFGVALWRRRRVCECYCHRRQHSLGTRSRKSDADLLRECAKGAQLAETAPRLHLEVCVHKGSILCASPVLGDELFASGCPRGSRGARLYQHFHHFGSHIFAHTLMGDDDIAV